MNHQDYNGWTNYETWNIKLWMDNDGGDVEYWNERIESILNTPDHNGQTKPAYTLSKELEDYYQENNPLNETNNTYSDLLGAALGEVNWYEIAEHMITDYEYEVEQDTN